MRNVLKSFLLLALISLLPVALMGQAISGNVNGVVKDATGAVVPGATVDATNLATNFKNSVTTNSNGEYHFIDLPAGHYKIEATSGGLKGGVADVIVSLNETKTINITATVAGTATTVEVSGQAVAVNTTNADIQNTFTTKQLEDLPITSTGSGVLNLSLLNAGVASSGGIAAGAGPSVSGQRPRNNNFTVEGVDNNNKAVTGPLMTIPNDAVESFTVLQNQFSPEFGHSSGGQFNQTIKSGTNTWHGSAWEYFQNRNLNAIDSQVAAGEVANGTPIKNTRFDDNRFGGAVGGPIIKNKLFFYFMWQYEPVGYAAQPVNRLRSYGCRLLYLAGLVPQFQQPVGFAEVPAGGRSAGCQFGLRRDHDQCPWAGYPYRPGRLRGSQLPELQHQRRLSGLEHFGEGLAACPLCLREPDRH